MPNPNYIPDDFEQILQSQRLSESSGRRYAVSSKGAIGVAQVMPDTAKRYGYTPEDMFDPKKGMDVQRRYMTDLLNRYQGDVSKALAAYNTGEGNIDKGIIPRETLSYVTGIGGSRMPGPSPRPTPRRQKAVTMFSGESAPERMWHYGSSTLGSPETDLSGTETPTPYQAPVPPEPAKPVVAKVATTRPRPPQPQNYVDDTDPGRFLKAIEGSYPGGWNSLTHEQQELYQAEAIKDWKSKRLDRLNQQKFGEFERASGPEGGAYPKGADPYAGKGELERARGWWIQNVNKPTVRGTQAVMGGLFAGATTGNPFAAAKAATENWNHPGDHPYTRFAAHMVPVFGADTPEQQIFDGLMLTVDPVMAYYKLGLVAKEGSKVIGPALRLMERTAVTSGIGAAAYTPRAIAEGDPWQVAKGAGIGAGAQLLTEGGSGLLRIAGYGSKLGLSKLYESDIGQSVAGKGTYLWSKFGKALGSDATGEDIGKVFFRSQTDPLNGKNVSPAEKYAVGELRKAEKGVDRLMEDHEFDVSFQDPYEVGEMRPSAGSRLPTKQSLKQQAQQAMGGTLPGGLTPMTGTGMAATVWPEGSYHFTWQEARQALYDWERRGQGAFGHPIRGRTGEVARSLARQMREFMATEIDNMQRGTGSKWATAKTRDEWVRTLTNIFNTPGVIKGSRINSTAMQKVVIGNVEKEGMMAGQAANSYIRDIYEILGSKDGDRFIGKVMRGGGMGSTRDEEGALQLYIRAHPGLGMLSAHQAGRLPFGLIGGGLGIKPELAYRGGIMPFDAGRGTWGLLAKLGSAGLFRVIQEALGDGMPSDYSSPATPGLAR